MKNNILNLFIMFTFLFFTEDCNSQNPNDKLINRHPAVAGQFYSDNPAKLRENVNEYFKLAKPGAIKNLAAIISPHAGYVFSGAVAASSINQVDPEKQYETIFLIGSSHVSLLYGASVYNKGNYITPLGTVKVDLEIANKLIKNYNFFKYDSMADSREHSLEVQLPFLQVHMKKDFKIVPIIIGTQDNGMIKKIANALKPYFTSRNLFIISSDFSHYPTYNDAIQSDNATADAILTNIPEKFLNTISANEKKYKNLATSICGWTSVLTLLYITQENKKIKYEKIDYKNSGDSNYGDKVRVVGYYSIAVTNDEVVDEGFSLTENDQKQLLKIARKAIEEFIKNNKTPDIDTKEFSSSLTENCGAFVTIKKGGQLRGCIGRFNSTEPLWKVVQMMAIASSTQDTRFSPVTVSEIPKLEIEISVLTPMKKINSIDEIEMGKHGIYIKKGPYAGTFLPQVATETGWTKAEFLGHCSEDKAGLGWEGWKTAEIFIYEAKIFAEK